MLFRLGQVIWWLGALVAGGGALGAAFAAMNGKADVVIVALALAMALVFLVLPAWGIAYVLAGSFWKPPRTSR